MRVIGVKRCDFKAQDGNQISGYQVFATDTIDSKYGTGYECEKLFLSDQKLKNGVYPLPDFDDVISVSYNKYGKVDRIDILTE